MTGDQRLPAGHEEGDDGEREPRRLRHDRPRSLLHGGGMGIALVAAATAGLAATAAVIALAVALAY